MIAILFETFEGMDMSHYSSDLEKSQKTHLSGVRGILKKEADQCHVKKKSHLRIFPI
jgi:hypothetical protein